MAKKDVKWKTPKILWRVYCKGLDEYELKKASLNEWHDDITENEISDPDCGLDFHAYYNWLYGEGEWEVIYEEPIEVWSSKELKEKFSSNGRWRGFFKEYGDGSCIGIPKEKDDLVVV